MQVRSGVNTIQGFGELILEQIKLEGKISEDEVKNYVELMLDSCDDIMKALRNPISSACK